MFSYGAFSHKVITRLCTYNRYVTLVKVVYNLLRTFVSFIIRTRPIDKIIY